MPRRLERLISPRMREGIHSARQQLLSLITPKPYSTVLPFSKVGLRRLRSLRRLTQELNRRGIEGDIVECGTCEGGSGALLAQTAREGHVQRRTWLLDSFEGMPPAGESDPKEAMEWTGLTKGSISRVRDVLRRVRVPEEDVTIVPGWFSDTLPKLPAQRIALLHIDADWYDSVTEVLDSLFDRVVPGGYVVLDDYGYWEGCSRAWHDFETRRGLSLKLTHVDSAGVYIEVPTST